MIPFHQRQMPRRRETADTLAHHLLQEVLQGGLGGDEQQHCESLGLLPWPHLTIIACGFVS